MPSLSKFFLMGLYLPTLMLAGCGLQESSTNSPAASVIPPISGRVQGGQQPISQATIQLYAVNTAASKGMSPPLISSTVLTDANGNFNITGDYTCPTPSSTLVYLVATGGNPGLGGTANNSGLAEMALLGPCNTLSPTTFIFVNELTTVVGVEALAPFMADYAHVGSDPANPGGLGGAFAGAATLVNFSTGQFQPSATGVSVPTALLNTLADILAACVNTAGGTAGDGSPCGTLFQKAGNGGATDTIGAMLRIAASPAQNVAALFGLITTQSPFQSALASAPGDFSAPVIFTLPSNTYGPQFRLLAIDTAQHIWVYSPNQTGSSTYATGPITVYDNNGNVLFTVPSTAGGLYLPVQLAADPFGNMWALNNNATVSKFDGSGNALSPTGGFPVPFDLSASVYNQTSYPHELGLNYMAIDPSGNVWGIGSGSTSGCFIELNNAGSVITPAGNFCASAANSLTAAVTTDASGDAWLVGTNSVAKVNPAGALVTTGVTSNGCFTDNIANPVTVENSVQNLFWDRVNNQVWGVGNITAGALHTDGTQVFCDAAGANLPVVPLYSTGSPSSGNATNGFVFIAAAALDGGGNLWFVTAGTRSTESNFSVSTTSPSGLSAVDPSGNLLTPFNAGAGVYGLESASANVVGENANLSEELAVDAYGNIWFVSGNALLVKVPGIAVPKNHQ